MGLLLERHPSPNWSFFPELRSHTGMAHNKKLSIADAFAISHYNTPGNGYCIAYEVKVSKNDFLNEIKQPQKRDFYLKNSNEFFFAMPKSIGVTKDEIPTGCGLIFFDKNKLHVEKIAPQNKGKLNFDCDFVASLLRRKDNNEFNLNDKKIFKYANKSLSKTDIEKIFAIELGNYKSEIYEKISKECKALYTDFGKDFHSIFITELMDKLFPNKKSAYMKYMYSFDQDTLKSCASKIVNEIEALTKMNQINYFNSLGSVKESIKMLSHVIECDLRLHTENKTKSKKKK